VIGVGNVMPGSSKYELSGGGMTTFGGNSKKLVETERVASGAAEPIV